MKPSDPLYGQQWHFALLGELGSELLIQRLWNDYTGSGVAVGIYDDGIQSSHSDIAATYDASLEVVINGQVLSGSDLITSRHGTAVAGLIAAQPNGTQTVGIAFGASLTGVNIFNPYSPIYVNASMTALRQEFISAIQQMANFDVVNNSWSNGVDFAAKQNIALPGSFADQVEATYASVVQQGRGGLGTIIVQAAGNENAEANGDGLNASRYTITVGAVHQDGFASSYSNHGASLLVTAPGGDFATIRSGLGIVTSDATGVSGYNLRDGASTASSYTDNFGGTSAATAITSAVVALMLDANPALGWRDVQNILAMSASHTGSALGATTPGLQENNTWFISKADTWNGGGLHYSEDYGYGLINAYAAVRMAEVWSLFAPAQTSANEQKGTSGTLQPNKAIADNGTTLFSFTVSSNLLLEHADLTLKLTHSYLPDLRIFLVSPEGTEVSLYDGSSGNGNSADGGLTWSFGVDALRGELSAGTWTIKIVDTAATDTGVLNSFSLDVYGTVPSANDVFTYTDEVFSMLAYQPARAVLSDTDGGTDWINAAAMTGNLQINLNAGGKLSADGVVFATISKKAVIENIVTGDGNDTLLGNKSANILYGMRGNDTLNGGDGNDQLFGGASDDRFLFSGSRPGLDTVDGGAGIDTLDFSTLALAVSVDLLSTGAEVQMLKGSKRTDIAQVVNVENMVGSKFADLLSGDNTDNVIEGGAGNDTLSGHGGADSFAYRSKSFGKDTITDFTDGEDHLIFASTVADSFSDFIISGNGTTSVMVTLAANPASTIVIHGGTALLFTAADFIFV